MCVKCYKLMKKISDKEWRDKHPGKSTMYTRIRRAKDPKAVAKEWRDRTERFKLNKKLRRAKKMGK